MKNIKLLKWQEVSDELAFFFVEKYFGVDVDFYWIADDVGGTIEVNDYFFNMSDITDFIKYNYSRKMMFKYYDYALEYHSKKKHKDSDYLINIKNYKKLK